MAEQRASRARPRTALVLGAGGVVGAAWMTGALPALQERLGCGIGDVDIILGTSAGSVLAAALRCGATVEEMVAYQRGEAVGRLAEVGDITGGPWPRPPRLRLGSPRLVVSALTAPHRMHPLVGASALIPVGRESHERLRDMVLVLHASAVAAVQHGGVFAARQPECSSPAASGDAGTGPALWADRGQTWIVAVDYDSGRRVVFGHPSAPEVHLADAVVASCSIPGWYEPFVIAGRRYVDGGVRSPTSLGLLADTGVEEVFVLAPMASVVADRPREPHKRVERRLRALVTHTMLREVAALRARGIRVTVVTPGPEDLAAMGVNPMDPRRRGTVLATSLRTSPLAFDAAPSGMCPAA